MFNLYDVDGDGHISKEDLNIVVSAVHNLIGSSGPGDHHAINNQVLRILEVSLGAVLLHPAFQPYDMYFTPVAISTVTSKQGRKSWELYIW